jgi:hypothetical protein
MLDTFLVPESTAISTKGDGPLVDIAAIQNRVLLLQLQITGAIEQESLDLGIFGGPDEAGLGKAPLASFPQLFYAGGYPLLLDLSGHPEIKVLRAHWDVNRWGRGSAAPWFEFNLKATEVSPELLRERQAKTR